jgi:hypothetical protein
MKELALLTYVLIGCGSAWVVDGELIKKYPDDNGLRTFSAVFSIAAWPVYAGMRLVKP